MLAAGFSPDKVLRFLSRPLDLQWAYVDETRTLWNRPRPELLAAAARPNSFLIVRRRAPRADDGAAMLAATCLGDQHVLHKDAYFIPFLLGSSSGGPKLFAETRSGPNLSPRAVAYLASLGLGPDDADYASLLWLHALAVAYSHRALPTTSGASLPTGLAFRCRRGCSDCEHPPRSADAWPTSSTRCGPTQGVSRPSLRLSAAWTGALSSRLGATWR